ncbi:MAG: PorP/SprF family type IX secretion system membrane protein [Flavobacteriaceae bacterium]
MTSLILLCIPLLLMGQQEVTFSQYMFNHQSLNPAYVGSKDYTQFALLHRTQWMNFPGAPESQAFTFNHKMTSKNIGFGFSGVSDRIGPMSIGLVGIDLAYHLSINDAFLAVGIKIGMTNFNFDENIIETNTPNDQAFSFDDEGEFLSNVGFGVYYHRPRWYAGFSVPWFIENENFNTQKHYYAILGGLVKISDSFEAKPSALVKHTQNTSLAYDLSALMLYRQLFWIGPQIRSTLEKGVPGNEFGGGLGLIAGVNINKSISLGYSYGTSALGNLTSSNHATHEIMLRFDLIPALKSELRSPRIF